MQGWGGILLLAVIGVGFGIVSVVISRFLGPDKLSLGMNFVFMDIPIIPGGLIEDRFRTRSIRLSISLTSVLPTTGT